MRKSGSISAIFIIAIMVMALVPSAVRAQSGLILTGTETRITTTPANEYEPAISGNTIVYTGTSGLDQDVRYYDLATRVDAPVTTAIGDQQRPDVSDGLVVYTDDETLDVLLFSVADGTTTNLTGAASPNSTWPGIGQGLVAWEDGRDGNIEIYAKNLTSGEERRVTNSPAGDNRPMVNNGIIVWPSVDRSSFCSDVYSYDWASGTIRQLTNTPSESEFHADVSGRYVVYDRWLGQIGGPPDMFQTSDICLFDLTTGIETRLAIPGGQINPRISGDYVSFQDIASGYSHIKLWYLPTDTVFDLTAAPGGPPSTSQQLVNDIDGNRIVYCDNRNGQADVYMYEFQILLPSISVDPQSLNFGEVKKGTSTPMLVTISNVGTMDLTLDSISLAPGSSSAFSITQTPQLPIPPGGSGDVTIAFAPTTLGSMSGTLQITSNHPLHGMVELALAGTGVYSEKPPDQQIQDILDFFDDSIDDGTLPGDGPGKSAENRRNALRNMIEAAGDLIGDGDIAGACQLLYDTYLKCDGDPQPPDFVKGSAAPVLASEILTLMQTLNCPQCSGL